MYHVDVIINLKKGIADPEGVNTKKALGMLGFKVKDVSSAKIFRITLGVKNKKDAEKKVGEMCRKLLANPVIHDYKIMVK
ncbi:MAG: phosphoribosylformylglycinamidine synthase subunit PurS [Thermoplasmatales archaeon]|nr:phosphoribosylformylglycinamidine synthase subunit PurS [Thermoplasmatales archaeon]